MTLSKKLLIIIPLAVIILGGIYGVISKGSDEEKIKKDPKQTTGTIVEYDNLREYNTNGCWIYYEYSVDGKSYKHCQKYHGWNKEDNFFMHYTFPVVYSNEDPDLSRLLIIEEEFKNFGLTQPDSLKKYNGRIL
ncbi:MAG: hypothetical protein K0Q95_96 [Bacteroidota bacterium]|jgi:hypothetical protein|nr:hypothetical protein [Bacteroidota bacterium]